MTALPRLDDDPPAWVRVSRDLATRIACGELAPGTALPPVRSPRLLERYGVSPETVRLAYLALEDQGLACRSRRRPPYGWQVAQPAAAAGETGGPR